MGDAFTGSVDGSVYMLELCEGLAVMQPNEKNSVMQMLERESKREKNLEARAKELKQKERRAGEASEGDGAAPAVDWETQQKEVEAAFWATVNANEEKAAPNGGAEDDPDVRGED